MSDHRDEYDGHAAQAHTAAEVCQRRQIEDATANLTDPNEISDVRSGIVSAQLQTWRAG
ncbi:hypothetical protein OG864_45300 [Streptomyces sp. NBC_00124]|uniref:hypothetical protein n=1 Tax=Streptomyces sp. NBC_00124 TaxID=2975662 RepID=UPI002252B0D3|nr:hypothetical protein [Streptomyces sp. NBC_00124]MCX5365920.1 hypothetical protein [Streptomyces sp. NBC_00124]